MKINAAGTNTGIYCNILSTSYRVIVILLHVLWCHVTVIMMPFTLFQSFLESYG